MIKVQFSISIFFRFGLRPSTSQGGIDSCGTPHDIVLLQQSFDVRSVVSGFLLRSMASLSTSAIHMCIKQTYNAEIVVKV